MQGAAKVSVPKLFETLPSVDGITVAGLVHSHPRGIGFGNGKMDNDVIEAQFLKTRTRSLPSHRADGRTFNMNFNAMFISAPEGGRMYYPHYEDPDRDFVEYDMRSF
jgi:hypothetical protein